MNPPRKCVTQPRLPSFFVCEHCGLAIPLSRPWRRFCSGRCRHAAPRARARKGAAHPTAAPAAAGLDLVADTTAGITTAGIAADTTVGITTAGITTVGGIAAVLDLVAQNDTTQDDTTVAEVGK